VTPKGEISNEIAMKARDLRKRFVGREAMQDSSLWWE
jgi:hypothetical protein